MTDPAPYRRSHRATQPEYLYPPYGSTLKRAPTQPLVAPSQTLSEVTGPLFGRDEVMAGEADLTRQHAGEPLGERIIVSGRVLDENGRALPEALIEIWQANAAGRYRHPRIRTMRRSIRTSPAVDASSRTRRGGTIQHDQARSLPMAQSLQRVAAGAHSLSIFGNGLHAAARHADVFSG